MDEPSANNKKLWVLDFIYLGFLQEPRPRWHKCLPLRRSRETISWLAKLGERELEERCRMAMYERHRTSLPSLRTGKSAREPLQRVDDVAKLLSCPKPAAIPSLLSLCAIEVGNLVQSGFIEQPDLGGAKFVFSSREARGRLFRYDARRTIKQLGRYPHLAQLVLRESLPTSTALFCAISAAGCFDMYTARHFSNLGRIYTPILDLNKASITGPVWINLTSLILRGCRVNGQFIYSFLLGPAKSTLLHLDLSETLIADVDVAPVSEFTNLKELLLNQCPCITRVAVENISHGCNAVEKLSLNSLNVPLPAILEVLMGTDEFIPFPQLRELHTESDLWAKHPEVLSKFLERRRGLQFWSVLPQFEYGDISPSLRDHLRRNASRMNYSELQIAYEFLSEIEASGNLKTLHIRIPQLSQSNINTIASSFETLTSLSLSNTNITESIDFSTLSRLEELKLVDITLGQVSNLPPSLKALVATISYVDSKQSASMFVSALTRCTNLSKLEMLASDGDLSHAHFKQDTMVQLLSNLPSLTDLQFDRDLCGIIKGDVTAYPIVHEGLQHLRLVSSSGNPAVAYLHYAPKLVSFESDDHFPADVTIGSVFSGSPNLRHLRMKVDLTTTTQRSSSASSSPGGRSKSTKLPLMITLMGGGSGSHKTETVSRSSSVGHVTAKTEPFSFYSMRLLTAFDIDGASENNLRALNAMRHLQRVRFNNCQISNSFCRHLMSESKNIRDIELSRCHFISNLDFLHGSLVAKLKIDGCELLTGPLHFSGRETPDLEIISLSNVNGIKKFTIFEMPQLRSVSLRNCNAPSLISITEVPLLWNVSIEEVQCLSVIIRAPLLKRLLLECYDVRESSTPRTPKTSHELLSGVRRLEILAPQLNILSWQVDGYPPEELVLVVKTSPALTFLTVPMMFTEEVERFSEEISQSCPELKTISCNDGDIPLFVDRK